MGLRDKLDKIRERMELRMMSQDELWDEYYLLYFARERRGFDEPLPPHQAGASWSTKKSSDAHDKMFYIMDIVDNPRGMIIWAEIKFRMEDESAS